MKQKILLSSLSLIAFSLVGCSGGGGGGPSVPTQVIIPPPTDTNTSTETNTTTPPVVPPPSGPGVDYTDPSQFVQTTNIPLQLSQINAQVAYNNGFTGGNLSESTTYTTVASDTSNRNLQTIIAVLDSGINANHEDLNSTGKIEAFKDFTATNSVTPYDNFGHGTMVSSILAGTRQDVNDTYYGVAYGAHLIEGQIITSAGTTDNIILKNAIDWAVQQKLALDVANVKQVVALNLSLGTTDSSFVNTTFKNSLLAALNTGMSIVSAAGNEGLDCLDTGTGINGKCSFPAAAPWVNPADTASYLTNNGGWVVVGSVDSNNNISAFSNKAGVTKSNYIVAPGENLIGAAYNQNDGYRVGSGTSFAAPLVSGALALFTQKWPHLSGRQHSQIMFDTATDLGAPGIDDVYGNGLLDLSKAFNPVGTVAIPTGLTNVFNGQSTQNVVNTSFKTSSSILSLKSLTYLNNTIGVDSYNRDFTMNLTNSISTTGTSPVDFKNFMTFNYGDVLFGVDSARNMPLVGYKFNDNSKIKVSYDNTFLGTQSEGALSIGNSNTIYVNYEKVLVNEENFKLNFSGNYAYGKANTAANSIITDIDSVQAIGGEVTAMYKDFGVGYEIPLRAVSGSMSFNTPTSIDNSGNIIYTQNTSSLNPDTFQQVYSMFYQKQMNDFYLQTKLSHTNDAYGINNLISNDLKVSLNYFY
jgi:subtilisin family serine protease